MEHFSEQAWADFERGLDYSSKSLEINSHLASGCLRCKAEHSFWSRLRAMGQAESRYMPPEDLVRIAKLGFSFHADTQADKWTDALLVFSSASQPLAAGMRSQSVSCRQLVYEADGLTMDLRLDKAASGLLYVVGQIVDAQDPRKLGTAAVILWTEDGRLITTTGINEFGEFCLQFKPLERMKLTARVGKRRIQIPVASWT